MEYPSRRRESRGTESLIRKILQLFGIERAFVRFLHTSEEEEEEGIRMDIPLDYSHWKQIETALLEAEHNKAMALMEMQRRHVRVL